MSKRESIEDYVRKGRKIMAIKIYRDVSSSGLKEAKEAVESYMSSGSWSPAQLRALGERGGSTAPAPSPAPTGGLAAVEALIHQGKKIHAIKELRRITKTGLRESKNAVEHYMSTGAWPGSMSSQGSAVEEPAQTAEPAEAAGALDLREVERHSADGKKIKAIKELRRITPMGLKDAKKTVEYFMAHGSWPATLVGGPKAPIEAPPQPAPTPTPTRTQAPPPAEPKRAPTPAAPPRIKAAHGDPEAEEAGRALLEHLGAGTIELLLAAKKNLFGGYLAVIGEQAFFMVERFGSWEVDGEYSRADGVGVEVRTSFSRIELRLRAGYLQDNFTGLDEAQAQAVAKRLGG